jgi:hypothetical protein
VVVAPLRGVELYERVAATYNSTRRADPRIAALIEDALGDARSVVNVGAGTAFNCLPGMSVEELDPHDVDDGSARLRADLDSGRWHERNAELLELPEMAFGYRLLVRELR